MNEDHVRAAYRIPKERCAHVQKFAASVVTHNSKKGKNSNAAAKITPPADCSAETDITCLNSFSFPSLPAKSNWPTGRLKSCFLGTEPPKALTAEELCHQQPSGIPNLGNTCYANSVCQCLARIGMDWSRDGHSNSKGVLDGTARILDHFIASWSPSPAVVVTTAASASTPATTAKSGTKGWNLLPSSKEGGTANHEDDANAISLPREVSTTGDSDDIHGNNLIRAFFSKLRCVYGERIALDEVMKSLGVNVYEQQDAQEFYVLLLQRLEANNFDDAACKPFIRLASKDGKSTNAEATNDAKSFLRKQIQIHMTSHAANKLTCLKCNESTPRREVFGLGGIPLHTAPSLEGSIKRFLQAEADPTSTFNCDLCDAKNVNFSTQYQFTKLPPIVCFHLLRFRYDPATGTRVKVQDKMRIPEFLDLHKLCGLDPQNVDVESFRDIKKFKGHNNNNNDVNNKNEKQKKTKFIYRLQCSVLHRGASATRGHYIAYVRGHDEENNNNNNSNNQQQDLVNWWCCDDDSVRRLKNPLFNKVTLGNNHNNNSSMANQMNDLYGNTKQPPGGQVVGFGSSLSKAQQRKLKQEQDKTFAEAKAEIEGKNNKEDIIPATSTNNNNNNHSNNNDVHSFFAARDDYPSSHIAWTSDEAFMVWYELCEVDDDEEIEEHENNNNGNDQQISNSNNSKTKSNQAKKNDKQNVTLMINVDEDASLPAAPNNNNNNNFDDSILYSTPEKIWPKDLLRQCRVSIKDMERMRRDYEAKLEQTQGVFESWRRAASFLSKGPEEKNSNWIALNAQLMQGNNNNNNGSHCFYAIPEMWLQQLRAASVRDGEFTDADTTADISSADSLFLIHDFEKEIFCEEHNLSGLGNKVVSATPGSANKKNNKNNNNTKNHCLKPLSAFRLVHTEFFHALFELILMIYPQRDTFCAFTLPCSPSNNNNVMISPSPFACESCVRQRIDDISSNKEAEQRYEKMKAASFTFDGKSVGAIVAQTSLGKSSANVASSPQGNNNTGKPLIDDEDDVNNEENKNNNDNINSGPTESPMYIAKSVRDKFVDPAHANNKNNVSAVEQARAVLHGCDLSENLVCKHNALCPTGTRVIIPRSVYDYLIKELSCFASCDLPLWSVQTNNLMNHNETLASPSPQSKKNNAQNNNSAAKSKKNNKNSNKDDADTLLNDDEDDDEENPFRDEQATLMMAQTHQIITREPCALCDSENVESIRKTNSEKAYRMAELKSFGIYFDNAAASNDKVLREKLKDSVKKHRQQWKESEQKRISNIMKERRENAELKAKKEAAIQQSGIKFTAGGRGRGGRGGAAAAVAAAAAAKNVVDVDAGSSDDDADNNKKNNKKSNGKRQDSPVLEDAAVENKDFELVERDPEPRIQRFALISYAFVKQWQRYAHQNPTEYFTRTVSDDGEVGVDPCAQPLLENYSLRCGCRHISGVDCDDLDRLVKELNPPGTKLAAGKGKGTAEIKPTTPGDNFTAVIVPMEFLAEKLFDRSGLVRAASNLDLETYKRDHLVTFVQRDEAVSVEPSPCDVCIPKRREALEASEIAFDDGSIEIKVELPGKRRGTKTAEVITLDEVSSDWTLNDLYRNFFSGVASAERCFPTDESLIRLRVKHHSTDIPQSDSETIVSYKIRRTGTEMKAICLAGGEWERKKAQDLEEEQLQQAIQNSTNEDMNVSRGDDPFSSLLGEDGAVGGNKNGGRGNNNKNAGGGGRQRGTVVPITGSSDAGRSAFETSRLAGKNNNNNKNNNSKEVACPVCTFLNAAGMRKCEMCDSLL